MRKVILPNRSNKTNKGDFGIVALVGGFNEYSGSIIIAANAALKSGCGMVKLYSTEKTCDLAVIQNPQIIVHRIFEENLLPKNNDQFISELNDADVVIIGPGLTIDNNNYFWLKEVNQKVTSKIIYDADALNIFAKNNFFPFNESTILTPHLKEFQRLTQCELEELKDKKANVAVDFAAKYNTTLVLKSNFTVITNGHEKYLFDKPTTALSKAGSGDILTGIIAANVAQGLELYDAAVIGVTIHNYAAQIAATKLTEYSVLVNDIYDNIPSAIKLILKEQNE